MVRCNRRECRIHCLAGTPSYYNNQNQMNELRFNQTTQPMQTASRSRCLEMKGKPAFIIRQGSAQVVVYKSAKGNRFCLCYRKHVGAARSRETRTGEKAARARALEVARDWKRRHLGEHCEYFQYTSVPAPRIKANNRGEGLPSAPGIYFVWEGLRCVYVGRSANLSLRCVLGKHPALKPGDVLSWIEEPVVRLKVAEAFYIGTLRPERNFRAAPLGLIIP